MEGGENMTDSQTPAVGDHVIFVDERRRERDALVVAVWPGMSGSDAPPGVNLVTVSLDADRDDAYGRQVERPSSIVHQSQQAAPGNYWRHA